MTTLEGLQTWHNKVFDEIITSPPGKHWSLSIPRRCGNTFMCERLASYFVKEGRSVYWQAKDQYPKA